MARVNVYLPDELVSELREAGLNLSMVTRDAVHRELARWRTFGWLQRISQQRLNTSRIPHDVVERALRERREPGADEGADG
jgi:post-segregation antitoxin CcdA